MISPKEIKQKGGAGNVGEDGFARERRASEKVTFNTDLKEGTVSDMQRCGASFLKRVQQVQRLEGGNMSKVSEEQQEGECRRQRSGLWGLGDPCKGSELLIPTRCVASGGVCAEE